MFPQYGADYVYTNRIKKKGFRTVLHYSLKVKMDVDRTKRIDYYQSLNWWQRNVNRKKALKNSGNSFVMMGLIYKLSPIGFKIYNLIKRFIKGHFERG